jgi:two-component system alkaline phosphatase synthesis response regulator PhoP
VSKQPEAVTRGVGLLHAVVVVSADRSLAKTVEHGLGGSDVRIRVTTDVDNAIRELRESRPSLVIADSETARGQLEGILAEARSRGGPPVIVVVSSHEEMTQCLDQGASDFILKPVSAPELAGRAALHGVRESPQAPMKLLGGGLSIDMSARRVLVDGETIDLTSQECKLLEFLASRPGVNFTREDLLKAVWESSSEWQDPATVTEHIHRLRHKLERDPSRPRRIVTVYGRGYRFEV